MARKKEGDDKKDCDVKGCSLEAVRSISAKKVSKSGLNVPMSRGNAHLCKDHYKEYKKSSKEERKLQRMSWT
jgi:hypothetical protein